MRVYKRDIDNFEVQDILDRDLEWIVTNYGDGFVEIFPGVLTETEENNKNIKSEIVAIESAITARRLRESVLGIDNNWLKNTELKIAELRSRLC